MDAMIESLTRLVGATMPWLVLAAPYALAALFAAMLTALAWQRRVRVGLQQQLQRAQQSLDELVGEQKSLYQAAAQGQEALKQLDRQEEFAFELQSRLDEFRDALAGERIKCSRLEETLQQERLRHQSQLEMQEQERARLGTDFENLANRIFEEKTEKFNRLSSHTLDQTLTPLRQQMSEFKSRVEQVYDIETRDRLSLLHQIGELKSLNQRISDDAIKLTSALKGDNKAQGNWGEVILERLLEDSGLRKGHEYDTQVALQTVAGQRRNPDVVIRLPDNRDIIIDAKVSLRDYERYYHAEDEQQKKAHLRGHVSSLKNHIRGLSVKSYQDLEGVRTLDFVLIFIPIETAFMLAFEHEPDLFKQAYEKNVILVSPTTLLATLRTIQGIWRYERQNRNAEEIALQAGRVHDQVVRVAEALEDIGKHIGRAQESWQRTSERLRTGKGNLLMTADKLEQLGAKTRRQLPTDSNGGDIDSE